MCIKLIVYLFVKVLNLVANCRPQADLIYDKCNQKLTKKPRKGDESLDTREYIVISRHHKNSQHYISIRVLTISPCCIVASNGIPTE